jgi:hypothetical protein
MSDARLAAWEALSRRLCAPLPTKEARERAQEEAARYQRAAVVESSPQQVSEEPRGQYSTAKAGGALWPS